MATLSDADFLRRLADFIDDAPPESIFKDSAISNRIQDILMSIDLKSISMCLSLLLAWTRKMKTYMKLIKDSRIVRPDETSLEPAIEGYCKVLAIHVACLFKQEPLLSLAAITCQNLVYLTKLETTQELVRLSLPYINHPVVRIPILYIIARSRLVIENLPILDPELSFRHSNLCQALAVISAEEDRIVAKEVQKVLTAVSKIERGEIAPDLSLLPLCDFDLLYETLSPSLLATHPDPSLRLKFYQKAMENNLDILPFLNELICEGILDPELEKVPLELLASQFHKLANVKLSNLQITCLQCIPLKEEGALFTSLCTTIDAADDLSVVSAWIRFLYHKEKWVRQFASQMLSQILPFPLGLDVSSQPQKDLYSDTYLRKLRNPREIRASVEIDALIEIVMSDDHPDDIKRISSQKVANSLLDPYLNINFEQLRSLQFSKYPELFHALSIRDSSFVIDNVPRLFELLCSINAATEVHLLPVLSRIVFSDIVKRESDGASLLRLPSYLIDNFEVKGNSGLYQREREVFSEHPLTNVVLSWKNYDSTRVPLLNGKLSISEVTEKVICDILFADQLLNEIQDKVSFELVRQMGSSRQVMYLVLMCLISVKKVTEVVVTGSKVDLGILCDFKSDPMTACKLNQALIEFGFPVKLPSCVNELLQAVETRRVALSMVLAHLNAKSDISEVNIKILVDMTNNDLEINVRRMLSAILTTGDRSEKSVKLVGAKDAITRSGVLHSAPLTNEFLNEAVLTSTLPDEEKAPVITLATAIEFCVDLAQIGGDVRLPYVRLINGETGESVAMLQLLRGLMIPSFREGLDYTQYVIPFLKPEGNHLFVTAAINSMFYTNFENPQIPELLEILLGKREQADNVLKLICTLDDETLGLFSPRFVHKVCKTLSQADISFGVTALNHLLIAGIEFPPEAIDDILSAYESYIAAGRPTELYHKILIQIMSISHESRKRALNSGFVTIILNELNNSMNTQKNIDNILAVLAEFLYGFRKAQEQFLEEILFETLVSIFENKTPALHFYLCLVSRNPQSQSIFAKQANGECLLDRLLDFFESNRTSNSLLLQLFSAILNSDMVRRALYRRKKVQSLFSRLTYAVSKRDWSLAEDMLRICTTLTFYPDGCDEMFDKTRVVEILEILTENEEIIVMPLFSLFMRNLKCHQRTWNGLGGALQKTNIKLFERLNYIADSFQN